MGVYTDKSWGIFDCWLMRDSLCYLQETTVRTPFYCGMIIILFESSVDNRPSYR